MSGFRVDRLDHVELFVPDRLEAASWYARVLGLEIVPEYRFWSEDPGGPLMVSSDGGRTKLALFEGPSEPGVGLGAGFRRVAFTVDGAGFLTFVRTLESLELANDRGERVTRAQVVDHELAFSIYFSDPWGHRFEVTTYDYDQVAAGL